MVNLLQFYCKCLPAYVLIDMRKILFCRKMFCHTNSPLVRQKMNVDSLPQPLLIVTSPATILFIITILCQGICFGRSLDVCWALAGVNIVCINELLVPVGLCCYCILYSPVCLVFSFLRNSAFFVCILCVVTGHPLRLLSNRNRWTHQIWSS